MKTDITILSIFLIISIVINIVLFYLQARLWKNLTDDYKDEKHFCNYCKNGYIHTKEERAKTKCDDCGRPLTLHIKNPNFQEEAIERENKLQAFEEFNGNDKGGE